MIKFHGDAILWKKGLKKTGSRSGHLRKDKNKIRILLLKLGGGGVLRRFNNFFINGKKYVG